MSYKIFCIKFRHNAVIMSIDNRLFSGKLDLYGILYLGQ